MRTIDVSEITENIKEMCMEANHYLSKDMDVAMKKAAETEESPLVDVKNKAFKINYISPLGSFATWRSTKQTGFRLLRR